jgi:hypothetical protein
MPSDTSKSPLDALSREIFERGVRNCLPAARLVWTGSVEPPVAQLTTTRQDESSVELAWLSDAYRLEHKGRGFTEAEIKLLASIGHVSLRYRALITSAVAADRLDLMRAQPEDRFVSAFLDPSPYTREPPTRDRVADAIAVLRISSSSTYENRRINSGVLLFGNWPDPCHAVPPLRAEALRYDPALTTSRTFHRLSDGMRTVAVVDGDGLMVDLVDIEEWAAPYADRELPVPCSQRFAAHCRATLCGGHVCLVLTPNGEIKAFANGMQVFNWMDGRWRLSDAVDKYALWKQALDDSALAERLFTSALNLAELRRGGLFVVLADLSAASDLLMSHDRLDFISADPRELPPQDRFNYLLRGKSALDLTPTVLESIARIDGAIVLDREANLLAFGAILRHHADLGPFAAEGGRTTAAIAASRHGHVLKVSEDGFVSFYAAGRHVWEL